MPAVAVNWGGVLSWAIEAMTDKHVGYDIVGDVHGCADALLKLLAELGYVLRNGSYEYINRQQPRQLIFLGDLIDRGPKIRETVALVRAMVERGSAQLILGNHEYNAVGYFTPSAREDKGYLHERNARHQRLMQETLDQYANHSVEWRDTLEWFSGLPMFLQFDHFRAVHACWDGKLIDEYNHRYDSPNLNQEFLLQSDDRASFATRFLSRITRGVSLRLPAGQEMTSTDGFRRRMFRAKFWVEKPDTYGDIEFQPDALPDALAKQMLSGEERNHLGYYCRDQRPLFVGHYWQRGKPSPMARNIACLDYSAVKGGQLVAYRMDNETQLSADKFVSVQGLSN